MQGTIYEGNDGQYYGDVDLWERFESGVWSPCCWDEKSGEEWVRTDRDELLYLRPVSREGLPEHLEIKSVEGGVQIRTSELTH